MRISGIGTRSTLSQGRRAASRSSRSSSSSRSPGVILALAAVNLFPSDEEVARRESGMLALAIEGARDEAWFGGRPDGDLHRGPAPAPLAPRAPTARWEPDQLREKATRRGPARDRPLRRGPAAARRRDALRLPPRRLRRAVPHRACEVRGLARAIEGDAAGAVRVVPACHEPRLHPDRDPGRRGDPRRGARGDDARGGRGHRRRARDAPPPARHLGRREPRGRDARAPRVSRARRRRSTTPSRRAWRSPSSRS